MKSFISCKDGREERNRRVRVEKTSLLRTSERSGVTEYGGIWVSVGLRGWKRGFDTGPGVLNGP